MIIIISGFILRIFLSFYNASFDSLPGAGNDALAFHLEAINYLEIINNQFSSELTEYNYRVGWTYSIFLAYVYKVFGTSNLLLGSLLSPLVWFISAFVLKKVLLELKTNKFKINSALFIYTFLFPSGIIYTSVTLREVYMLCFVNLILLFLVRLINQKKKILIFKNIIFFLVFLILLAGLHRSNIIFAILFLLFLLSYYLAIRLDLKKFTIVFLGIFAFVIFYQLGLIERLFNEIKSYQMGHFHLSPFRAGYYTKSEISSLDFSLITFLSHVLKNVYNYFFQPSIFKISSSKDIILFYENLIRGIMMLIIFAKIIKSKKRNHLLNILFIMLFLSELPYSQATINWGTASRHHVQIFGLLMVLLFLPKELKNEKKK